MARGQGRGVESLKGWGAGGDDNSAWRGVVGVLQLCDQSRSIKVVFLTGHTTLLRHGVKQFGLVPPHTCVLNG